MEQIIKVGGAVTSMINAQNDVIKSDHHPIIKLVSYYTVTKYCHDELKEAIRGRGLSETPFHLSPDELFAPTKSFNHVMYKIKPDRKCYNAKNTMKLKHFVKFCKIKL